MNTYNLLRDGNIDIRLSHLYFKIIHKYKKAFDTLDAILENNGTYLTLIALDATPFKSLQEDFPEIKISNKFRDNTQLKENNKLYIFITLNRDSDYTLTNNTYNFIYEHYIDKVDDIYRIDKTAFVVLSNDIDVMSDILNEISELFNYTCIDNRHIFTLKL